MTIMISYNTTTTSGCIVGYCHVYLVKQPTKTMTSKATCVWVSLSVATMFEKVMLVTPTYAIVFVVRTLPSLIRQTDTHTQYFGSEINFTLCLDLIAQLFSNPV